MRQLVPLLGLALVLAACGDPATVVAPPESTTTSRAPPTTTAPPVTVVTLPPEIEDDNPIPSPDDSPPPLVVTAGAEALTLEAFTYCWSSGEVGVCADGIPPSPPPLLRAAGPVTLGFPLEGWSLSVTTRQEEDFCSDSHNFGSIEPGGTFQPAGSSIVSVFARGPQGDAAWSFAVEAEEQLEPPPPSVAVTLFSEGGQLDAEAAVQVAAVNLERKPSQFKAEMQIVAAGGTDSIELDLADPDLDCWTSTLPFFAPDVGAQITALGEPPYGLAFTFELDGFPYTAGPVAWPDDFDERTGETGLVPLTVETG